MQNAIDQLLATIGMIVSTLSPLAKAIVAAVLPVISALVNMAIAGSFNTTSIIVLVTGAITAMAVYLVQNKQKPAGKPLRAVGK